MAALWLLEIACPALCWPMDGVALDSTVQQHFFIRCPFLRAMLMVRMVVPVAGRTMTCDRMIGRQQWSR